jgi:hypothetical protein
MHIGDISGYVGLELTEQLKGLAFNFKNFPFYIHMKGHRSDGDSRGRFTLYWAMKKEYFSSPDRDDVVSELHCEVIGIHDSRVLLRVSAPPRRKYPGQEPSKTFDNRNWYKQDWRSDHFIVEAKPSAIWTIMEAHADFSRVVIEVMNA